MLQLEMIFHWQFFFQQQICVMEIYEFPLFELLGKDDIFIVFLSVWKIEGSNAPSKIALREYISVTLI